MDYSLSPKKINIGPRKGQLVYVASPVADRKRITFRAFCERVAKNTTLSTGEVMNVLEQLPSEVNFLCGLGHIVDLGALGSAYPRFTAKSVGKEEEFKPSLHISKPRVEVRLKTEFKNLKDVVYNRVEVQNRVPKKPDPNVPDTPDPGSTPGGGTGGI